jgi:hypothetical protein
MRVWSARSIFDHCWANIAAVKLLAQLTLATEAGLLVPGAADEDVKQRYTHTIQVPAHFGGASWYLYAHYYDYRTSH